MDFFTNGQLFVVDFGRIKNSCTIPEGNMVSPFGAGHDPGGGGGAKFPCKSRGRTTSSLPISVQSVVLNYWCYCGVRIELA